MKQLELDLKPRLAYSPEAFVLHSGVAHIAQNCLSEAVKDAFSILYVQGPRRSGKTHFSIFLSLALLNEGCRPVLLEGTRLPEEIALLESRAPDSRTVFLVDDVDQYFSRPHFEDSGQFVHLVEYLRNRKSSLFLFSSKSRSELPVDEHVQSRLLPGAGNVLGPPEEADIHELLKTMAAQRGIFLQERKRGFLLRRIRHDVPSIERFLNRVLQISTGQGRKVQFSLLEDAL